MVTIARIESGTWQREPDMEDYRAEWLTDVLVERATWGENTQEQRLVGVPGDVTIAAPGYVWARFWFRREGWIVEKYFDQQGDSVGFYAPICGPIEYHTGQLGAEVYGLALWMGEQGRVVVLGEESFDEATAEGEVTPVAQEQAEHRIRELTTLTAQKRFPPAFVRNFGVVMD